MIRRLACCLFALSLLAIALPGGGMADGRDADAHPLIGRTVDARTGETLIRATLIERLRDRRFILIGERHDNPVHHRLQAALIAALGAPGDAVVFEMLGEAQADALPAPGDAVDLEKLGEALAWETRGWPDFAHYRPIFEAAGERGLRLLPGAPARAEVMAVARGGLDALAAGERADLPLDRPLPEADRTRLLDRIEAAHCGHAPRDRLGPMLDAQRLKDARMARAMVRAAETGARVFLIAGGEHVRGDWGVPRYLRLLGVADTAIATVLPVEVEAGVTDWRRYPPRAADGAPAVDALAFTRPVDTIDPCEKFKDKLEKMGGTGSSR